GREVDHDREAGARTARNTAVSGTASFRSDPTRTTAPASLTSITVAAEAGLGAPEHAIASATIGTKQGASVSVGLASAGVTSWRAARRQPNTCCEQTCQRRATSDTLAPGTSVSATIRA